MHTRTTTRQLPIHNPQCETHVAGQVEAARLEVVSRVEAPRSRHAHVGESKSSLTNASLSSFAFCSVTGRRSDRVAERVEVCSPQLCWASIRQPVVLRLLLLALCAKLLYLFSREAPQLPSANTHDMREAKRLWTIIAQCSAVLCCARWCLFSGSCVDESCSEASRCVPTVFTHRHPQQIIVTRRTNF